jgi:hypothetical protein
MESSTVRVRPLRFVFLVDPRDKVGLLKTFEVNSSLWGGIFNFIVPLFKQVPSRYREKYHKPISAKTMLKGLLEAFQPDFLIETKAGQAFAYGITFPSKRTLPMSDLLTRDERGRSALGVDLRSVCDDLYEKTYRFVQRHPPKVVIPVCTNDRYSLLFAATFGYLPESGELADVADIYLNALDGKRVHPQQAEDPLQAESCSEYSVVE